MMGMCLGSLVMMHKIDITIPYHLEDLPARLDKVLALQLPDYSRHILTQWIRAGYVNINGKVCTVARRTVQGGEHVKITAPPRVQPDWVTPEAMHLAIMFEDEQVIIVNKPAGLVVHPGHGHPNGTLVNGLLHYAPELAALPRAGIVHRLDKDTTGLLIVARTLSAHVQLIRAMQSRDIQREYRAIVHGDLSKIPHRHIHAPIGRHPVRRTEKAVHPQGIPASTTYQLHEQFAHCAYAHITLGTGRTHQIRVHMQHVGHPLVGDPVYGKRALPASFPAGCQLARQALHAYALRFPHPDGSRHIACTAPLPIDMEEILIHMKMKKQAQSPQ